MYALVIDASAVIRQQLVRTLEALGWEVGIAQTGREALQHLNALSYCDLVFADWCMPDMDGLELCRAVRNAGRHQLTPIIMTAYDVDAAATQQALQAGANAILNKPFARQTLQQRMVTVMSAAYVREDKVWTDSDVAGTTANRIGDLYRAVG
jgi:CheY-like chemotaxis protein